jgi:hypothetical protein
MADPAEVHRFSRGLDMKRMTAMLGTMAGLFLLLMAGCNSDPVKDDIVSYSKKAVPAINRFDEEIAKKMDEVSRENDRAAFLNKIRNEMVPLLKDVRARIEAEKPKTGELQEVHQLYAGMLSTMEGGMNSLAESIETNNQVVYRDSIEKINSCQQTVNRFKAAFKELARKHDVELD